MIERESAVVVVVWVAIVDYGVADHCRAAELALDTTAQGVFVLEFRPAGDALGVVDDLLHALPEFIVDDAGRCANNLDLIFSGAVDLLAAHPAVLTPRLDPARATVGEPPDIGLVLQNATD